MADVTPFPPVEQKMEAEITQVRAPPACAGDVIWPIASQYRLSIMACQPWQKPSSGKTWLTFILPITLWLSLFIFDQSTDYQNKIYSQNCRTVRLFLGRRRHLRISATVSSSAVSQHASVRLNGETLMLRRQKEEMRTFPKGAKRFTGMTKTCSRSLFLAHSAASFPAPLSFFFFFSSLMRSSLFQVGLHKAGKGSSLRETTTLSQRDAVGRISGGSILCVLHAIKTESIKKSEISLHHFISSSDFIHIFCL